MTCACTTSSINYLRFTLVAVVVVGFVVGGAAVLGRFAVGLGRLAASLQRGRVKGKWKREGRRGGGWRRC